MSKKPPALSVDLMDHPSGSATGMWPGPRKRPCGCRNCCVARAEIAVAIKGEPMPRAITITLQ
jgi:hypothetical protein